MSAASCPEPVPISVDALSDDCELSELSSPDSSVSSSTASTASSTPPPWSRSFETRLWRHFQDWRYGHKPKSLVAVGLQNALNHLDKDHRISAPDNKTKSGLQQKAEKKPESKRLRSIADTKKISSGIFDESTETCIALLVIALGCAGDLICSFVENENSDCDDVDSRSQRRTTSELYFDIAFKKIRLAQAECSVEAVQCLFFTGNQVPFASVLPGTRFAFGSGSACGASSGLAISSKVSANIHSDDLAELSALPLTGVADIELSVPLPGVCHTQGSLTDEEQSSLYFLACISMRRLLNRATNLLYARDTGVGFDEQKLPSVVAEFAHQLESWKERLPPQFQFPVNQESARTQAGTEISNVQKRHLQALSDLGAVGGS
ncbi:hypothetical protein V1505DRAFT_387798 [Lipomyces doorenjongii]